MTNQELFDKTWQHFIVEKNPFAKDEKGYCKYSSYTGGCAIGIHLQKKDANRLDALCVGSISRMSQADFRSLSEMLGNNDYSFLKRLQESHDLSDGYSEFAESMMDLAKEFELTIPTLDTN